MSLYRYTDRDDDLLTIDEATDGVWVHANSETVNVAASERWAAAQAMAGDRYRVVAADTHVRHRAALEAEIDRLRDRNQQLYSHAAQPDRLEPVDPASVRVGDVVEVTQQHDEPRLRITVEGEVYETDPRNKRYPFHIRGHGAPAIGDRTTVRVLRAAEPEPDPEVVAALEIALTYSMGDKNDEYLHSVALDLARRNVRMVRDA